MSAHPSGPGLPFGQTRLHEALRFAGQQPAPIASQRPGGTLQFGTLEIDGGFVRNELTRSVVAAVAHEFTPAGDFVQSAGIPGAPEKRGLKYRVRIYIWHFAQNLSKTRNISFN